ncbi:MAG: efflux RND transporter periplasmic adaptor subunit [Spirochaetales bacterium]|nr:efflux RND transporter periplasmic adaptor subunit [Spirochaetales bacterium]
MASSKKKSSLFDKLVTVILLMVVLVLAYLVGNNIVNGVQKQQEKGRRGGQSGPKSNEISVVVQDMEAETFIQTTTIGAEITNTLDSYSLSSEIGGKITKLLVQKNQSIKAGDIIAYVDPSVAGAQYKEQPVRSSLSGVIDDVKVYAGQTVSTSTAIATVGSVGELEITARLPERFLSTVEVGMNATFTTAAWPEEKLKATVKSISSTVNSSNRTFTAILSIEPDPRLKAGMYVTLDITTDIEENVLMLPTTAIGTYLGDPCVYVVEDGKAARRIVRTGKSEKDRTVVTEGLSVGDRVVVKGSVTEGAALKVVE